jgi:hypothetical protein
VTDVSEAPALEPDQPVPAPPPPINSTPVDGAADLPDDVKNGEIPGEDDPAIADEPPTADNQP